MKNLVIRRPAPYESPCSTLQMTSGPCCVLPVGNFYSVKPKRLHKSKTISALVVLLTSTPLKHRNWSEWGQSNASTGTGTWRAKLSPQCWWIQGRHCFVTYIKAWQEPGREQAGRRCKSPRRSGAGPCRNAGSCCHCCLGEELGHTELSWRRTLSVFFSQIAKDLKQVSGIIQPKPFILYFTSSWFI